MEVISLMNLEILFSLLGENTSTAEKKKERIWTIREIILQGNKYNSILLLHSGHKFPTNMPSQTISSQNMATLHR
jgi:hypothetical protein